VRGAGWGHRGKQRRSLTWRARRADQTLSAKRPCNAAHSSVAGLFGWLAGSVIVFLTALPALIVAGHHAGDIRRGLRSVQLPACASARDGPAQGQAVQRPPA
jgi:hypothetical protein